jgi:hypothetical protein
MHGYSQPFWPQGLDSVVIVVWTPDNRTDTRVVFGVDLARQQVRFEADLRPDLVDAFINAVKDGRTGTPVTGGVRVLVTSSPAPDESIVVIPDPPPGPIGPRRQARDAAITEARRIP